jgi:NAD(P)-dependent dehydrogenase (short-subunit alcohol dehydrogenase family)
MNIENKIVLITGANRGIGRALVEEALKRGAKRVCAATRHPFAHDRRVEFSPESVARGIFDGLEKGEEDIFPDPMSESIAEGWRTPQ